MKLYRVTDTRMNDHQTFSIKEKALEYISYLMEQTTAKVEIEIVR